MAEFAQYNAYSVSMESNWSILILEITKLSIPKSNQCKELVQMEKFLKEILRYICSRNSHILYRYREYHMSHGKTDESAVKSATYTLGPLLKVLLSNVMEIGNSFNSGPRV